MVHHGISAKYNGAVLLSRPRLLRPCIQISKYLTPCVWQHSGRKADILPVVDLRIRSLVVQLQPQALQQHARPIVYHSVREQKIALAGRSNKK